jgi:hypothetical protein
MIDHLDRLIVRVLRNGVAEITSDGQVRFQPPDEDWRAMVPTITDGANLVANSLNVYLADLRENRLLRSNERERSVIGNTVLEAPPPRRVDCHYLISAWSPADAGPAFDPTPDEHALLAEVARALGAHDELDPVAIYAAAQPPLAAPAAIADQRFPITLMPGDGFPKIAEFWGTMGEGARWKPFVYVVVTLALSEPPRPSGPMVTTTFTDSRGSDWPSALAAGALHHIGGVVRDNAVPAQPVARAWVELLTPAGERQQLTRCDADGRFVFAGVRAGPWRLRASMFAFGVSPLRDIRVPEPSGHYDIPF